MSVSSEFHRPNARRETRLTNPVTNPTLVTDPAPVVFSFGRVTWKGSETAGDNGVFAAALISSQSARRPTGNETARYPGRFPDDLFFACPSVDRSFAIVTKPLAVVFYERLLPGSRIANRLADLGWRVAEAKQAGDIVGLVRSERPLVVVAELQLRTGDLCSVISELKLAPETEHVPVLGYGDPKNQRLADAALAAGARLVVAEAGVCDQLPQLLDHVLAVE